MKITTSQLRKIIRSEYQKILLEQDDPWNDPVTPEELETDKIAQELENAWKTSNQEYMKTQPPDTKWRTSGEVDSKILDLAIATSHGKITMEDALKKVVKL